MDGSADVGDQVQVVGVLITAKQPSGISDVTGAGLASVSEQTIDQVAVVLVES